MSDTPENPDKAFKGERAAQVRQFTAIQRDTAAEVTRLLTEAGTQLAAILAAAPTDYQAWNLPLVQQSIRTVLDELGADMAAAGADGTTKAWDKGVDLVDAPLAAAGLRIDALMPMVDRGQLMAMRTFVTDRLKNVAADAGNKINSQLGLVMIGAQTPSQAVTAVEGLLEIGGRDRAVTIVRTELGRAFSSAGQQRMEQAAPHVKGLQKQWRRSGKRNSRLTHNIADGQVVDVAEPFSVGGEKMMFPRDPKASAKNTVNCGCVHLPYMASWEVLHPKNKPFTPAETADSEIHRRLADVQALAFDRWARNLLDFKIRAGGNFETAGVLGEKVKAFLAEKKVKLVTEDIAISDKQIQHLGRDEKAKKKKKAVPPGIVRRLPDILAQPKAVLWDKRAAAPTLIYVAEVPGVEKLAKFVVKLGDEEKRNRHKTHNWIVTAGMVDRPTLNSPNAYDVIEGEI